MRLESKFDRLNTWFSEYCQNQVLLHPSNQSGIGFASRFLKFYLFIDNLGYVPKYGTSFEFVVSEKKSVRAAESIQSSQIWNTCKGMADIAETGFSHFQRWHRRSLVLYGSDTVSLILLPQHTW